MPLSSLSNRFPACGKYIAFFANAKAGGGKKWSLPDVRDSPDGLSTSLKNILEHEFLAAAKQAFR